MKKFSKESMQQFLLMHAEKLILGACLAATGLFVWMSMGEGQKAAQTPSDLKRKADAADTYINKDAWAGPDGLENFREGKVKAKEQIENTQPVDGTKFRLDFGGSPAEALAPRKDPTIFAPESLVAHRFVTGVVMSNRRNSFSPLSKFNPAPKGGGSGTRGGGSDTKEGGSDTREGGSDTREDGSGTREDGSDTRIGALDKEFVPLNRGSEFSLVNFLTSPGIRPQELGLSNGSMIVVDGVCVTAVVDFKKQSAAFEKAFGESIAYNSKRDRPVYQCLQVQRREVSEKGDTSEWRDITEAVTYTYARRNPLRQMPLQVFGSAPEVISPENFDPILTQAIPAFAQWDYQDQVAHPALEMRRKFPDWVSPQGAQEVDGGIGDWEPEQGDADDLRGKDEINNLRKGTATESYKKAIIERRPGGQYRLVRFFDLLAPKERSFEYRVRVWVGDPNQLDPFEGFVKNRGQTLQPADGGDKRGSKDENVRFAGTGDGASSMAEMSAREDRDGKDETPEVVVPVKPTMLVPGARQRISACTDLDAMQDRLQKEAQRLKEEGVRPRRQEDGFQPFQVAEYTADGKLEQIELPPSPSRYAYIQYLRYARPSAWSETVRVDGGKASADVMAGPTVRKRPTLVGGVEFDQVEPSIKVLVSSWNKDLGARLSAEREAHIGETMNFRAQAYVTHPLTREIKVPEVPGVEGVDKYKLAFKGEVTIVDAFFGSRQVLAIDKRLSMEGPTEILTMDSNGNFKVSNQFAATTDYRNELALPDDSRFYGKPKRQKKPKGNNQGGGNFDDDFN